MPHIYLDRDSERVLEGFKKDNPQFNLSNYVQKMIKEYSFENEEIDISKVTHEIENIKIEINRLEEKTRYLKEKRKAGIIAQKKTKDDSEQKLIDDVESVLKYTHLNETEATILVNEYHPIKHKITLTAFLTEKKVAFK